MRDLQMPKRRRVTELLAAALQAVNAATGGPTPTDTRGRIGRFFDWGYSPAELGHSMTPRDRTSPSKET
ncbi:MAG: hypothetical protein ACRYG8_16485, partial [Janthinobacterium lividum]